MLGNSTIKLCYDTINPDRKPSSGQISTHWHIVRITLLHKHPSIFPSLKQKNHPSTSQGIASGSPEFSPWYILNNGSHTVTARCETLPFWNSGRGVNSNFSAEASSASPDNESSSSNLLYAATMFHTGVKLKPIG